MEQEQTQSTGAGDVFKVERDGTIKILKKNLFTKGNLKSVLSLSGKVLTDLYKDAHDNNGNFNNTFRTLTMGVTALIPYGGALISPLIGLLWPENVPNQNNQIEHMVKELTAMMDEKIENYDREGLQQQVKSLMDTLHKFQDSVNDKPESISEYDSIQVANITYADIINTKFKELIELSRKKSLKVAELPIFTVVAIAHLHFLHFMKKNAEKNPRIKMDPEHLRRYFLNDLNKITNDYVAHITNTYKEGHKKAYTKITEVRYDSNDFPKMMNLWNNYKSFYFSTFDNQSFWDVVDVPTLKKDTAGWLPEGPNWYYLEKGAKKTGWLQDGDKWYYLKSQGHMRIGWFQVGDKWYFFSPKKTDKFAQGQMVTGWAKDHEGYGTLDDDATQYCLNIYTYEVEDRWYYFSPENNTKNYAGNTFNQGQMVTDWFQLEGKWYYASPDGQTRGLRYKFDINHDIRHSYFPVEFNKKGQVVIDAKVEITNSDGSTKEYIFDPNGVCVNP